MSIMQQAHTRSHDVPKEPAAKTKPEKTDKAAVAGLAFSRGSEGRT